LQHQYQLNASNSFITIILFSLLFFWIWFELEDWLDDTVFCIFHLDNLLQFSGFLSTQMELTSLTNRNEKGCTLKCSDEKNCVAAKSEDFEENIDSKLNLDGDFIVPIFNIYDYKATKHIESTHSTPYDPTKILRWFTLFQHVPSNQDIVNIDKTRFCEVHEFFHGNYSSKEECDRDLLFFSEFNVAAKHLLNRDRINDLSWPMIGWLDLRTVSCGVQEVDNMTMLVEMWRLTRVLWGDFVLSVTWVVVY
jgi:hypothetical protein